MKSDKIINAVGLLDDDLLEAADRPAAAKRPGRVWVKAAAAAAVVALAVAAALWARWTRRPPAALPSEPPASAAPSEQPTEMPPESVLEKKYDYAVDGGPYASYVQGRVIEAEKVGEMLASVTVTAGWTDKNGVRLTEEHAEAELFAIRGVPRETAVALRFLTPLEAETVTFYYVILNPAADLTPVAAYVIPPEPEPVPGEPVPE